VVIYQRFDFTEMVKRSLGAVCIARLFPDSDQRYYSLTAREREVMALVVRGLSNKQIAAELVTEEKPLKLIEAGSYKRCKHRTWRTWSEWLSGSKVFLGGVGGRAPNSKTRRTVTFNGSVSCSAEAREPTFP